ncbi:MAG: Do family serine endopeptidase [Pseudomonadota bacterium]
MNSPKKSLLKSRARSLAAGVFGLGLVTAFAGQTLLSTPTTVFAEPVRVEGQQVVGFADVVDEVKPAVVSVRVKSEVQSTSFSFNGQNPFENLPGFRDLPENHPFNRFFREFGQGQQRGERGQPNRRRFAQGQGSGFFISEDGFVVTNNHVVDKGTEFLIVTDDGTELEADLIGTDARTDLALLKVKEDRKFTYVKFADTDSRVGEWVVAVGNPFGLGGTVTAGIVSARGRDIGAGPYDDFLQIDAAVNKGNSGGPAFNLNGEVIGVNTAIFSPSGGNVGIAFAIPAATAKTVIEDLKDDGKVVRGFLGVQIQSVSRDIADSLGLADTSGALVTVPQDGSPASKAGVRAGDTIVAVNGQPIDDPKDLSRRIAGLSPGTDVDLTVFRDGKSTTITVKLGELPERQQAAAPAPAEPAVPTMMDEFGLELKPADDGNGVVVTNVLPDSPLAEKGIRVGDVISEIAGTSVKGPGAAKKAIDAAKKDGKKAVLLRVEGRAGTRFVALPVKDAG